MIDFLKSIRSLRTFLKTTKKNNNISYEYTLNILLLRVHSVFIYFLSKKKNEKKKLLNNFLDYSSAYLPSI